MGNSQIKFVVQYQLVLGQVQIIHLRNFNIQLEFYCGVFIYNDLCYVAYCGGLKTGG